MNDNVNLYCDPNAFIKRVKTDTKPKVDINHIERVMYPVAYENIPTHYDKTAFSCPSPPSPPPQPRFDISKLMPLLCGKGNLSSMLPNLLKTLNVNSDMMPLLNNFAKPKEVKAKVVENNDKDTISKYEKVQEK